MVKKEPVWIGWISGLKSSEQILKDVGVEIGEWNPIDEGGDYGTWENCKVSDVAMKLLDPYWGVLIWSLEEK